MNIKTLLVHLDADPRGTAARIALAAPLAARHGSHVIGLAATGLPDVLVTLNSAMPDGIEIVAFSARHLRERADAQSADFERQMRDLGVASFEARVEVREPLDAIVAQGRCSDLVIVSQADRRAPPETATAADFPQQVMLHTGAPVLVVPQAGTWQTIGRHVVVAWKDTREAAHALRSALPVLVGAERVELVEIAEDRGAEASSSLLAALAWLRRHGAPASLHIEPAGDVGERLLSRTADAGADLLVMGAYGHSRLREWVLGGATRHVLDHMTLPVLMAH